MDIETVFEVGTRLPVVAENGGLFLSRGVGMHPSRTIPSHEIILVRSGILSIREEDSDFLLGPGQALVLRPKRHHVGTAPYPPDLAFFWLHFRLRRRATKNGFRVPRVATLSEPERLEALMHRFLDDQESGRLAPHEADLLVMLMLAELAAAADSRDGAQARLSPTRAALAARAEDYVRTHFHEPIGAGDVARALRCNADYLGRVFRAASGRSLTEALQRRRIAEAGRRLVETTLSTQEIAEAVGFQDAGYMRRLFRRYEGMSPRAYRRLYARVHVNTE